MILARALPPEIFQTVFGTQAKLAYVLPQTVLEGEALLFKLPNFPLQAEIHGISVINGSVDYDFTMTQSGADYSEPSSHEIMFIPNINRKHMNELSNEEIARFVNADAPQQPAAYVYIENNSPMETGFTELILYVKQST
jgi:hypothetical protein